MTLHSLSVAFYAANKFLAKNRQGE